MRTAYKLAKRFGGKIVTAGRSKHPKIVGLDAAGKQIKMTIPSSPSDNARTAKNVEAQLRRAGFVDRSKAARVKDTLVKGSKETAIPSRRTANQQTTFKDFTQKFQPNVQGPRKPNRQPKRGKVQGPETELENRMKKAYDKRVDAVLNLPDKVKTKTPLPAKMPKKLTDYEMYQLRNLKFLDVKQRKKLRELGLLEQMVAPKKPGKRDLLNLTPSEKKLDAIIQLSNRPGVRRALIKGRAVYPFSEDNKHRDAKINYQYKEVTNPKKPVDPVRALKLKKA